jgi:hypothetical protein
MSCPCVSTISFYASTKHYQDVMMAKLNKKQLALLKKCCRSTHANNL